MSVPLPLNLLEAIAIVKILAFFAYFYYQHEKRDKKRGTNMFRLHCLENLGKKKEIKRRKKRYADLKTENLNNIVNIAAFVAILIA